jgi:pyruvate dehydrogenase E1 component
LAVIVDAGMREMLVEQHDVFYYITLMNENYAQPDLPAGAAPDVLRGGYRLGRYGPADEADASLLGSGAILTEVVRAALILAEQGLTVDVYSVTSWSELARDGQRCAQAATEGVPARQDVPAAGSMPARDGVPPVPHIAQLLSGQRGPVIAATDYVRAVAESVRAYLPPALHYVTLGTDGFGRSDTRAALRRFFGVDAQSIAHTALDALQRKDEKIQDLPPRDAGRTRRPRRRS